MFINFPKKKLKWREHLASIFLVTVILSIVTKEGILVKVLFDTVTICIFGAGKF